MKFLPRKNLSRGLTLIELLVVVAILGILAAVLLAAVDPIQQQLKATDAVAENTANEFVQSNYRYYGSKTAYPWYPTPGCYAAPTTTPGIGVLGPNGVTTQPFQMLPTVMGLPSIATSCVSALTSSGELKSSFSQIDANILNKITINQPAQPGPGSAVTSLSACYLPQSKSGLSASNAIYAQNGALYPTAGVCPGGAGCYYCAF